MTAPRGTAVVNGKPVSSSSRGFGSLRRTMTVTTVLIVLYGLALPTLVLRRLLPAARLLETETEVTLAAFSSLRAQSGALQDAAALVRALDSKPGKLTPEDIARLAGAVKSLHEAPRAEYNQLAPQMRQAFAVAITGTDIFMSTLDEAVRAAELGEELPARVRLARANDSIPRITGMLDEAQQHGLSDLLQRQRSMRESGRELVLWTIGWLFIGSLLLVCFVYLTRQRLLRPLDALETGLTQLSDGDLEARIEESGDELGRLARVFNRASEVLRRRAEEQGRFAAAGQLLADVAHEVNNPLMAILGTAETRMMDPKLDAETRQDLQLVREQAKRAGQLLSGLLRFVRAAEEPAEVVALADVASRAIELVAYQFPLHAINCHSRVEENVAPVRSAATRLEQVLVNLLTNAVQAMTDVTGPRRIEVHVFQEGEMSCIAVRDNGPGVSALMRDRLFQPFASTKGDRGTGLGLYICRRIAREAGGDLKYSEGARGAEFTLCLPACTTPKTVRAVNPAESRPRLGQLEGLQVLLVDDEPGVRTAIARYLSRNGALVREAAHGLEALAQVDEQVPDVILLDLRMPVMDGYAFMARLRQLHPDIAARVLVLSGDLAADKGDDTPVPPDRMLAKPVALGELAKRLREVADASLV